MAENRHEISDLYQMQSLSLDSKIRMTDQRIQSFIDEYGEDRVYVSVSGKDSSVLLHRVRERHPNVLGVFINTGLEYTSVRQCALSKPNVIEVRPKMNFKETITKCGYPIIGKEVAQCIKEARIGLKNNDGTYQYRIDKLNGTHKDKNGNLSQYNMPKWKFLLDAPFMISDECCPITKKRPAIDFEKENDMHPIMGTMAWESRNRLTNWLEKGCNVFDDERPMSRPISFWTENDILTYIHTYKVEIPSIYGDVVPKNDGIYGQMNLYDLMEDYTDCEFDTTGAKRTGCTYCLFGITQDLERFLRFKKEEPKIYDYVMGGGEFDKDGMWKPNDKGMGFKFVIDWLNENGGLGIKY